MPVRQLPEQVVNRIAAGEVVERPASVVKELVENAIDAGASRIDVSPTAAEGGGSASPTMAEVCRRDLALAVDRHATSKLDDEDLLQHHDAGFRGEALPSIGSVAGSPSPPATERAACLDAVGRGRREIAGHAGRARPRHPGRGR